MTKQTITPGETVYDRPDAILIALADAPTRTRKIAELLMEIDSLKKKQAAVPDMIEALKETAQILDKVKADSPEGVKYVLIHHKIKAALRKAGQIE